jgi:hypothetical protein
LNFKKKNIPKNKVISLILSILIHLIIFTALIIIRLEIPSPETSSYTILNFIKTSPGKSQAAEKPKLINKVVSPPEDKKESRLKKEKEAANNLITNEKEKTETDTTIEKPVIKVPGSAITDTSREMRLKFAATLLDSFLVRHPEYSEYILQQQAKALVENRNIKKFSRMELEEKVNKELDDYLKKYYPEGSEHAINKYTGPGLQIPLDGLIESIKKIFK